MIAKTKGKATTIPAIGYVRMSTNRQEASPEQQKAEILRLAERSGYSVIRWYADEGISGDKTEMRKSFQRIAEDAVKLKDFKAILCFDFSRFGRFDSLTAGKWIAPLRDAGLKLVTVADGEIDWNTSTGRIMSAIQAESKNTFLVDLSRNTLRGKIAAAKAGRPNSSPPLGYDRAFFLNGKFMQRACYGEPFRKSPDWETRFVVSEDTEIVEAVQWAFKAYAEKEVSLRQIARQLNGMAFSKRLGMHFESRMVSQMLKRRAYIGDIVFGINRSGKYHRTGADGEIVPTDKHSRNTPPIETLNAHVGLVDRKTFERVQEKLASRRQDDRRPQDNSYVLSGVLSCGFCGGRLYGRTCRLRGRTYRYYACDGKRPGAREKGCAGQSVRADKIEDIILNVIWERLLASENLDRVKAEIARQAKSAAKRGGPDKAAMERAHAKLEKQVAQARRNMMLADDDDAAECKAIVDELKAALKASAKALEDSQTHRGVSPERLVKDAEREIKRLAERLEGDDHGLIRQALREVFDSIRITWERKGKLWRLKEACFFLNVLSSSTPAGFR